MRTLVISRAMAVTILASILASTPSATAAPDVCVGSYSGSTFDDLVVPEGRTCQLNQFNVVNGNIKVKKAASLIICPDNSIQGDIRAKKPGTIHISDLPAPPCGPQKALGITIGGDIRVRGGGVFRLLGNPSGLNLVEGDVVVVETQTIEIVNHTDLRGDVVVKHNGDVTVTGNTIGGDLRIRGTSGHCVESGNSVAGDVDSCP